jgi:hypothetical protein
LLHGWSHARRLQDKGGLVTAAIHRAASAQAATIGVPVKERVKSLIDLVDETMRMARDFAPERKRLPPFTGSAVAAYAESIRERVEAERFDYIFRSLLTVWLFDIRSLSGKLEAVVELMGEADIEPPLMRLLDGIAADTLIFAEVIQEMFGTRANLGDFLCVLADLLRGRPAPGLASVGDKLSELIARGQAPACHDALTVRLVQEVMSDKLLDKLNPAAEGALLDALTKALTVESGTVFGGEAVQKALSSRRFRHRQAILRSQGLHSIADNLRAD